MRVLALVALHLLWTGFCYAGELRVWQGDLYYKNEHRLVLLKSEIATRLQGYGVVDNDTVFLAYQPKGPGEAVAIISLIDLRTGKERRLDEIGGSGASFFDFNRENGLVVFSLSDGIYVFRLNGYKAGTYKRLIAVDNPYEVFWADAATIGYTDQTTKQRKLVRLQSLVR